MGCDIHIVLERRDHNNDCWVGIHQLSYLPRSLFGLENDLINGFSWVRFLIKGRNYAFFNDLCGVRGDGSAFGYEPRGLPEDMSSLSRFVLGDDNDLHSASWLTMDELEPVLQKHWPELTVKAVTSKLEGAEYIKRLVTQLVDDNIDDENHNDWRLVFAFDN